MTVELVKAEEPGIIGGRRLCRVAAHITPHHPVLEGFEHGNQAVAALKASPDALSPRAGCSSPSSCQ